MAKEVPAGGLLPRICEEPEMTLSDLLQVPRTSVNHPSFGLVDSEGKSAKEELSALVEAGHAVLFTDTSAAEHWLKHPVVPSQLADVTKPKPGGGTNTG